MPSFPTIQVTTVALALILSFPASAQTPSTEDLIYRGRDLEAQGQFAKADELFHAALKQAESDPSSSLMTAIALDCLATTAAGQMRYLDAERLLLRALSLSEHAAGAESRTTTGILWHLAGLYGETGNSAAAEPILQRYAAIVTRSAKTDPAAAAEWENVGRIDEHRGAIKQALGMFQRALEIMRSQPAPDNLEMARVLIDCASALGSLGKVDEAISSLGQAEVLLHRLPQRYLALEIDWDITAGRVYAQARRPDDAESVFQKATETAVSWFGATHPVHALVLGAHAEALRLLRRKKEAHENEDRARRIYKAIGQSNSLGLAVNVQALRSK